MVAIEIRVVEPDSSEPAKRPPAQRSGMKAILMASSIAVLLLTSLLTNTASSNSHPKATFDTCAGTLTFLNGAWTWNSSCSGDCGADNGPCTDRTNGQDPPAYSFCSCADESSTGSTDCCELILDYNNGVPVEPKTNGGICGSGGCQTGACCHVHNEAGSPPLRAISCLCH
jgi:hypothetical protein